MIPVLKGVAEIFRESEKLRENRERARLKFLFLKHGWTAESFQEELERRIGFHLDPAVEEKPPDDIYRDHVGIHPQKQAGYSYVGAAVLRGRISAQQMRAAADAADRYAAGELRTTNMQNLLIVNVPNHNAAALAGELEANRTAGRRFAVLAGRGGVQRLGVLQDRDHRDQEFFPLAGGRTRGAPARL